MIKHIVMWKLKDENKAENALKIKTDLEALKNKIDVIVNIEVGINIEKSDAAYDIVLVSEFASQADLDEYQINPNHKAVSGFVRSVIVDRVVVDYNC